MVRRFVFALIPVFVNSNAEGSLQASIAQAVAIGLLLATAIAMPYATRSDNAVEILSHVIINVLILEVRSRGLPFRVEDCVRSPPCS